MNRLSWLAVILVLGLTVPGCVLSTSRPSLPSGPPRPPAPPDRALVDAVTQDCAALYRDELRREIDAEGIAGCTARGLVGEAGWQEAVREFLHTTDEYAALHRDVDLLAIPLPERARIFGAMWTARYPLPWGPRPGQPSNILQLEAASIHLSPEALEPVLHAYTERGYWNAWIGPVGNPTYHGQYPDYPDFRQEPARYWAILRNWANHGIRPICFLKPDNWSADQLETLTGFYSSPEAQSLCTIVVLAWEPSKDTPNAEWVRWVQWQARVFPNALRAIHMEADFDAPGNNDDFTKCWEADGEENGCAQPNPKFIGMPEAWRRIAPFIHLYFNQVGGYATSRDPVPSAEFKREFCKLWDPNDSASLTARFQRGTRGYPRNSAWGSEIGIIPVASEFAAYGSYWDNFPEETARDLGDFALACGAGGTFDGGHAPPPIPLQLR